MSILVRAMNATDLTAVNELDTISFSLPWPPNAFDVELTNPGAQCWVAEADGQIAGALVFWRVLDEAELATLSVHPGFRRRGIARKLLQTAIEAAHADGARIYHLEVRAGNLNAQALYKSFGFEAVGRRPKYYRDNGEDAVLMSKIVS